MAHFYRAEHSSDPELQADWDMLALLDSVRESLQTYPPAWNLRGAIYFGRAQAMMPPARESERCV